MPTDDFADSLSELASRVHSLAYTPESTRTENVLLGVADRLKGMAASVRRGAVTPPGVTG